MMLRPFTCLLILGFISVSGIASAEPKAGWRLEIKDKIVQHICQDKGEWLSCFNQKPKDCESIIGGVAGSCLDSFSPDPSKGKDDQAVNGWLAEIGSCVDRTFLSRYGKAKDTPECFNPPPHLR